MAKLDGEIQTFILAEFARGKSGAQIGKNVKKEFGVELNRQQVWYYNPENPDLAEKWKKVFEQLREKILEDVVTCPGWHQGFRMRELVELYYAAKAIGNSPHAAQLLRQMAQERGDVFTNRRNININPRAALAELLGVPEDNLPEGSGK